MTKEEITELRGDLELLTKEELIEILIDKEKKQASMDQQASKKGLDRAWALGYYGSMSSRFQPCDLFRTFETEKEFNDFVEGHSLPEERRLLWLGFAFGCNFAVNKINKDLDQKKDQIVFPPVRKKD